MDIIKRIWRNLKARRGFGAESCLVSSIQVMPSTRAQDPKVTNLFWAETEIVL
jgi:hypothetical protein